MKNVNVDLNNFFLLGGDETEFEILVRNDTPQDLINRLRAALISYTLRLKSIDGAMKTYVTKDISKP